jgi:hypothetical protein
MMTSTGPAVDKTATLCLAGMVINQKKPVTANNRKKKYRTIRSQDEKG